MIVTPPDGVVPAEDLGSIHFVGIGGAGMSGIARILLARGLEVSGSDVKESGILTGLRALGARVHVGHDAKNVGRADTVVVSTAIRETNPEVVAARDQGLRILPRASALASVMAGRRAIAVAGTHGKTTTTSMLTVVLQHCGADPSFAIGGNLNESGANAHNGTGELFVAEADESDASFLAYDPEVAIVTNVEADHLDNYGTDDAYVAAFESFIDRVRSFVVVCVDDPGARELGERAAERGVEVHTYGESPEAMVRVGELELSGPGASFELVARGRKQGRVQLRVPGRHNALNAAGAFTAALGLGFPASDVRDGLAGFSGTRRRFELKGTAAGVRVYDDYAHHPTEVAAVLAAARPVAGGGRLIAVFQPHLFSRTRLFAEQFGAALGAADEVIVMDVYAAREDPQPGVTGALVAEAVPLPSVQVTFEQSWSKVPELAASGSRPGDVVLTIGAGDVTLVGPEILEILREDGEDGG
ncbi:UDP-N-acetylmuramate--L-alanine ligase [Actinobacteria bacterium YIM 96077]|uniref:UDP-N-acetylmuramate--L-alanine ligase n=1 Tax=Phytoactinopolyspora halophila TaxID=1981511 RepID=A0A329QYG7_9ACTN|nr:UDP-N-acetylmuramate--L-alanine ligase [Phytoactinopolyspora halophila]AYY12845.1 UDP-N-acetylmuramate--L-alanine ligase [Actinobacteria bacterium YIM 96077]RAW16362.1 UDP-N-acetylmuramate--L-alanine ligase [Phytoactinopolyspora halophila]